MGGRKIGFKDLGRLLHLDSGTLTPVLKKLESMELIKKYRSKEDDRIVIVEITEKGKLLREEILDVPKQIYCKLNIEAEELIALKRQLDDILAQISE
jgi:transcriptional regulator, MarR family